MPAMIALRLYLSAHNRWAEFLFLTSNNSVNLRSDFLVLVFLKITNGPGDIGLLSVTPLGVDTIYPSIMELYCC